MSIARDSSPSRSLLATVNPLAKILVSLGVVSLAFALKSLVAAGILVGTLVILLGLAVPKRDWSTLVKPVLFATIALLLLTAIATWLLNSLPAAILNSLRLVAILLPTPLLAITTPSADLVRALQAAKLPAVLVLSLMLVWRFLPLIQQEAQRIWEANQLRGIDLSRQPRQWFPGLFVPLIFRIVSYADEVTVGLETRGYDPNAPRGMSQPLRWLRRDTVFVLSSVVLSTIVGYLNQVPR